MPRLDNLNRLLLRLLPCPLSKQRRNVKCTFLHGEEVGTKADVAACGGELKSHEGFARDNNGNGELKLARDCDISSGPIQVLRRWSFNPAARYKG